MAPITVGIIGASGETGGSIVNGLLEAGNFDIIAFTRPSSMDKPANKALQERGVILRPIDLTASQDSMVTSLSGIAILISSIAPLDQLAQLPLVTAAKTAGVKRFLPCAYMPVVPPGGTHILRDQKETIYNHTKTLGLPYTIIDVGWWYQLTIPNLPSGKTDYVQLFPTNEIAGNGDVPSALTELRDIGRYIAKIIVDERTLNEYVFVFNELWTQNQIYDLYARLAKEEIPRTYVQEAELRERIAKAPEGLTMQALHEKIPAQYMISWGLRGDNQPGYASYLGYLTSKELYPDFEFKSYENYAKEALDGKAARIYEELRKQLAGIRAEASSA